ncbi:MAG: DUF6629 family protein [Hyphomicrobium sp.]
MCFSATASFMTAIATGTAGVAALQRTGERREWPLGGVPLLFAAQQTIEGLLWLTLPVAPDGMTCAVLTHGFLIFALLVWPIFAPIAALSVEDVVWRRRLIGGCLIVGIGVSLYLLSVMFGSTHEALLKNGHIIYDSRPPPDGRVGFFYLIATGLGPALSSHRAVNLMSIIVVIGSVVAYVIYWDAFVSVWCFFAAAASIVIVMHFDRQRADRRARAAEAQTKLA